MAQPVSTLKSGFPNLGSCPSEAKVIGEKYLGKSLLGRLSIREIDWEPFWTLIYFAASVMIFISITTLSLSFVGYE